jgi:hypothetical protein
VRVKKAAMVRVHELLCLYENLSAEDKRRVRDYMDLAEGFPKLCAEPSEEK